MVPVGAGVLQDGAHVGHLVWGGARDDAVLKVYVAKSTSYTFMGSGLHCTLYSLDKFDYFHVSHPIVQLGFVI